MNTPRRGALLSGQSCPLRGTAWRVLVLAVALALLPLRAAAREGSSPAPSSSAATETSAGVTLGDREIFRLFVPRAGRTPQERARRATDALSGVWDQDGADEIKVVAQADGQALYVADTPVIVLTQEDAVADGEASVDVYAKEVAQQLHTALQRERRRSSIAKRVFSFSLVVFFGLIALYLLRKLRQLSERGQIALAERADRIEAVRIREIEVISSRLLRTTLALALVSGRILGQIGIVYTYLVVVLSLFASTRAYTQKLTGFLTQPLSAFAARVATSLPLLVVALIAALAVALAVRFVALFFDTIERGESRFAWISRDQARPASFVLRAAIVLAALVFAAPVVTGDSQGSLAQVGSVALSAVGLAMVPFFASVLIGAFMAFGGRLSVGDHVEIGTDRGRVRRVGALHVELEDERGAELFIPHLALLFKPVRTSSGVEVELDAGHDPEQVRTALSAALGDDAGPIRLSVVAVDREVVRYRVEAAGKSRAEILADVARVAFELKRSPRSAKRGSAA